MAALDAIPTLSCDLIEDLDREYPHRCADPNDNDREMWIKVGERRLVDRLMRRLEKSNSEKMVSPQITDNTTPTKRNSNNNLKHSVTIR